MLQNDLCQNAVTLPINTVASGTTSGATSDLTILPPGTPTERVCVSEPFTSYPAVGVWYTFTSGCGGEMEVSFGAELSTCDSGGSATFDTVISVYMGGCGALQCVAGQDDSAGCGRQTMLSFPTIENTQYHVLIHGFGSNQGLFDLSFEGNIRDGLCGGDPHFQVSGIVQV